MGEDLFVIQGDADVAVWLPMLMMWVLRVFWFIVVVRSNYEMTVL